MHTYLLNRPEPLSTDDRWRLTLEDIDGLIAEVLQAQPMLPSKRNTLLGRLYRVRANLEILKAPPQ